MIPYVGGKYQQSNWMKKFIPKNFKRYGEVFSGAMWFYIKSNNWDSLKEVYYNDLDPLMYNLFTCFKQYDEMIKKLENLPAMNKEVFNQMKKIIQQPLTPPNVDIAAAHVYLCTHIFSGITGTLRNKNLKMTNKQFKFEKMKDQAVVKRLKDQDIRNKFDKIQTSNLSYAEFINKVDGNDLFLYIDPPYWKTEKLYREGGFNKENHQELSKIMKKSKCKWMLSYYDFSELHEWFPEDKYKWLRKKYKKMSANAKGKKTPVGEEILIMNYDCEKKTVVKVDVTKKNKKCNKTKKGKKNKLDLFFN